MYSIFFKKLSNDSRVSGPPIEGRQEATLKFQMRTLIFIFSYPNVAEKVLFLSQIFEIEILIYLCILRPLEFKNHIFSS